MVRRRLTPLSLSFSLSPARNLFSETTTTTTTTARTRFHRVTADINSFSLLLCFLCLRYKQARKGIHPLLRRVQYVGTNGQTYQLWSTVKQHQDRFFLSQDQYTHPAWTGIPPKSAATGQAAKFKRRGFDFLSGLKGRTTNQQQQGAKKQPTKK